MTTIAFIDDELNVLNAITRMLRKSGWKLLVFTSPEEAIQELKFVEDLNIVVSDYRMPGMDGVTLLNTIKSFHPKALRIILSGHADLQTVLLAVNQAEIYRFITKPWVDEELLITLQKAVEHQSLLDENLKLSQVVRQQQNRIQHQLTELKRLEVDSPGITHVDLTEDGYIDLSSDFSLLDENHD
jgi:two-component system, probable response regulator PhcQ